MLRNTPVLNLSLCDCSEYDALFATVRYSVLCIVILYTLLFLHKNNAGYIFSACLYIIILILGKLWFVQTLYRFKTGYF